MLAHRAGVRVENLGGLGEMGLGLLHARFTRLVRRIQVRHVRRVLPVAYDPCS